MPSLLRRALAGAAIGFCLLPAGSFAEPLEVIVTAYRSGTAIDGAGTDITVLDRAYIENSRVDSVAMLLRTVPGVTLYESGGASSQALAMLRGANAQHTLVLVDGVKVNDPSSSTAQFDFSTIALTDVERIEILKGPQTALYGSDALGGVIQIITRRGGTTPRSSATVEAGAYGTFRSSASASGSNGPLSLATSGTFFRTDGFSRVGNRDSGEPDGSQKFSGTFSGAYDPGEGLRLDFALNGSRLHSEVDKSSTVDAAGYLWDRDLISGYGRLSYTPPGSALKQSLTLSAMHEAARFTEPLLHTDYGADTKMAEYQGELRLRESDNFLFGGRLEDQSTLLASPTTSVQSLSDFFACFALYRMQLSKAFEVSLGGRFDGQFGGEDFLTGRLTAAYRIAEWGTKFRGSLANGANRPTPYQLLHPIYGTPDLSPERSIGADIGVDQSLQGGRLILSATGFYNSFEKLILFNAPTSKYLNISEAETGGLELSAKASLIPDVLQAQLGYNWLHTVNLSANPAVHGKPLARRPENSGTLSLTYTGIERVELIATAIVTGMRFNDDKALVRLAPYGRLDLNLNYRLSPQLTAFSRVENLFNATYREITGYNMPGLSVYGGLTWKQ